MGWKVIVQITVYSILLRKMLNFRTFNIALCIINSFVYKCRLMKTELLTFCAEAKESSFDIFLSMQLCSECVVSNLQFSENIISLIQHSLA